MNEERHTQWNEASWRRKLNREELARFEADCAGDPEALRSMVEDQWLTRQLQRLPDAPVSSNFTAQVLQQVEAEQGREARAQRSPSRMEAWWRRLVPRLAVASLLGVLVLGGTLQYQTSTRAAVGRDAVQMAEMIRSAGINTLKEYEAIRSLPSETDDDLLAALQ